MEQLTTIGRLDLFFVHTAELREGINQVVRAMTAELIGFPVAKGIHPFGAIRIGKDRGLICLCFKGHL